MAGGVGRGALVRAAVVVAARPRLWPVALRVLRRVGLPSRRYLSFRLATQYGPHGGPPTGEDLCAYLAWVDAHDAATARRRRAARRDR
jgi:hypothetical protein